MYDKNESKVGAKLNWFPKSISFIVQIYFLEDWAKCTLKRSNSGAWLAHLTYDAHSYSIIGFLFKLFRNMALHIVTT